MGLKQFVTAAGLGAGVTYLSDPECGPRRREMLKQTLLEAEWPESGRITGGIFGGLMALKGLTRSGISGPLWLIAGAAVLIRAYTNRPLIKLAGEQPQGETAPERPRKQSKKNTRDSLTPSMSTAGESGLETAGM